MYVLTCFISYNKSKSEYDCSLEEAQTIAYQYYVTVCPSDPPTKQFWEAPCSRHASVVCLSECCNDDQQGNGLYWERTTYR